MSVGKKLRELRGSRTQDEISKELGITKSSYAMYERDERYKTEQTLEGSRKRETAHEEKSIHARMSDLTR